MKFKKEIITGICKSLSSDGKGIIKSNSKTIFCDGLFLNEKATVETIYQRAGIYYAKIKKLENISKDRIEPRCKVCSACGGCQFQQLSYNAQLEYKKNKVKEDLLRIGKINTKVNDCVGMDDPYYYRNKIQIPVGLDKYKNIITGFYKSKSHEIVPINECYIEDKRSKDILINIKKLMKDFKILPYNEDLRTGDIRHILIKTSYYKNEIMVVFVTSKEVIKNFNNFIKSLIKLSPNITTIIQNINKRDTNVILGEKEKTLYGKGYIEDKLCDLNFKISSKSFYQINPIQCEKLYNITIKLANLNKDEIILDAYSGIGTIGLIASKHVKEVYSVEINKEAFKDGIKNAKLNNISNVKFANEDATKYILNLNVEHKKLDCIFLDPPRSGSTKEFLLSVLSIKPKKIIYISCDPATLSRDLTYLVKDYNIDCVQPVDMFPMTSHVETVVALSLKK